MQYPDTEESQMDVLRNFVNSSLDWRKGLNVWRKFTGFGGIIPDGSKENSAEAENSEKIVSFRCTCYRTGTNHKFKSTEVQTAIGGAVHDLFHWNVKCKNFDMEFVINCDVKQVYCCLTLTNTSLYHRTVTQFGPCTLRPTICAGLIMHLI